MILTANLLIFSINCDYCASRCLVAGAHPHDMFLNTLTQAQPLWRLLSVDGAGVHSFACWR